MKIRKNSSNLWWHHKKIAESLNLTDKDIGLSFDGEEIEVLLFKEGAELPAQEQIEAIFDLEPVAEEDEAEDKLARRVLKALKKLKDDPDFKALFK